MSSYEIFGRAIHDDSLKLDLSDGESQSLRRLAVIAAYEAALAVASEVRIETVLRRIVDLARSVVFAEIAAICQPQSTGAAGVLVSSSDAEPGDDHDALELHLAALFAVLPSVPKPTAVSNLSELSGVPLDDDSPLANKAALLAPILSGDGRIGTLVIVGPESGSQFESDALGAIGLLSEHAAAAVDRARMFDLAESRNERARAQLLQLREVLDNLPAGVLVIQPPDAWIQMTNNTAIEMIYGDLSHRSTIPVIYRDFNWQSADGLELPRYMHPGMRALRGERVENRQLILVNSRGDQVPVLVQSAPVLTNDNEIMGAVIVFQDYSRLRAAEQIKDDFLSLISHEFRTPLTAIHGGALLLQQQWDDLDEDTRSELLADIGLESSRLDRMLGNLLSVAEIMAGRFQGETEPIVIEPLVKELIDDVRRRSDRHQFTLQIDSGLPLAEGDPAWLSQIMQNLYENAVKYSPAGGEIRTKASRNGDWVRIQVVDSGLGILPEHVPHVFERFRRPGADPTVRGMGLGLYLSRLLVDAMGGRIRAESDGPGTGSTFTVELPVVREWVGDEQLEGVENA
ncbi:MAG: ATP-binding protein [Thermomicrobiales bacterium]|nr:ATP-binding protein [Thermomicrobiales bacterium]MCO5227373.1 ATP-binding protein [Thermomicrobiales bacterium]